MWISPLFSSLPLCLSLCPPSRWHALFIYLCDTVFFVWPSRSRVQFENYDCLRNSAKASWIWSTKVMNAEQQHHERQPDMRHVLFEGLFGCNSKQLTEMDHFRLEVLSKLVSLAVSIKGVSILECAAIWIYNQVCVHQIDSLHISHNASGVEANIRLLVT